MSLRSSFVWIKRNQALHVNLIFAVSLLVHVLYAMKCLGYYHPDEHFQILEFAGTKLSITDRGFSDMPWEFHEKIRSSIQPYFVIAVSRLLTLANAYDPFTLVIILQLFAAVFSWMVGYFFFRVITRNSSNYLIMILFAYLFTSYYFFPLIHSRFSSESISGTLIMLGLALVLNNTNNKSRDGNINLLFYGLVFGFAVVIRFQSAFIAFGLFAWLIIVKKSSLNQLSMCLLGFVLPLMLGFLMDRLFYSEWVITPWRYFYINIVEDKAAAFGTKPFWSYFTMIYQYLIAPYSAIFIISLAYASWQFRTHLAVFVFLPFLLGHMVIGHKELRFLFPVIFLLPVFLFLILNGVKLYRLSLVLGMLVFVSFFVINTTLTISLCQPLNQNISLYRYIYKHYQPAGKLNDIALLPVKKDPYALGKLKFNFYKPINLSVRPVTDHIGPLVVSKQKFRKTLVVFSNSALPPVHPGLKFIIKFQNSDWRLFEVESTNQQ